MVSIASVQQVEHLTCGWKCVVMLKVDEMGRCMKRCTVLTQPMLQLMA